MLYKLLRYGGGASRQMREAANEAEFLAAKLLGDEGTGVAGAFVTELSLKMFSNCRQVMGTCRWPSQDPSLG